MTTRKHSSPLDTAPTHVRTKSSTESVGASDTRAGAQPDQAPSLGVGAAHLPFSVPPTASITTSRWTWTSSRSPDQLTCPQLARTHSHRARPDAPKCPFDANRPHPSAPIHPLINLGDLVRGLAGAQPSLRRSHALARRHRHDAGDRGCGAAARHHHPRPHHRRPAGPR
jgi:hypothetical protein